MKMFFPNFDHVKHQPNLQEKNEVRLRKVTAFEKARQSTPICHQLGLVNRCEFNCCDCQRVAHPQLNRPPSNCQPPFKPDVCWARTTPLLTNPPLALAMGPPSRRSMQRKRRVRRRPSNPSETSRAWKRKSCRSPQLLLVFFRGVWGGPCGLVEELSTDALDWNPVIPFLNASKLSPGSKPISDWILVEEIMRSINHQENLKSDHKKWTDQPQLQDLLGPEFGAA